MQKERVAWMDLVRVLSVLLVLMLHTFDHANLQLMVSMSVIEFNFYQIIRMMGRIAVPLFIMISGILIINRAANEDPIAFYKRRIPQFLLIIVIYTILNNYLISIAHNLDFNIGTVLSDLLTGRTGLAYHMWYMFMITGLYIFAPFIGRMIKNCSQRDFKIYLFIGVFLSFVPKTLLTMFQFKTPFNWIINGFGTEYVMYFVSGLYIITFGVAEKVKSTTLFTLFILLTAVTLLVQSHLWESNKGTYSEGVTWYSSIFIYAQSIIVFLVSIKFGNHIGVAAGKKISALAKASFFTYLIHLSFLDLIYFNNIIHTTYKYLNLSLTVAATYIICITTYYVLSRLRFLSILIK